MSIPRLATCLTGILIVMLVAATGCSNNDPVSAGVQPQVINETDSTLNFRTQKNQ